MDAKKRASELASELMKPREGFPYGSSSPEDRAFRAVDAIIALRMSTDDPQEYGEIARAVIAQAIREAEQEATERAALIAKAHVICNWSKLPGKAVDDAFGRGIAAAIRARGGRDE